MKSQIRSSLRNSILSVVSISVCGMFFFTSCRRRDKNPQPVDLKEMIGFVFLYQSHFGDDYSLYFKKNEKNKTLPFLQLKGNDSISPSHQYFFNPDGKIDKLIDNTKNVISNYSYPNSFLQIIKYQSTSTGSIYRTDSCFLNAENKIVKIRTLGKTLKDSLLSIYDYKNNNISKQIIQHKTFTRTDTISYSYDEIKPNPFATLEISSFFIFENQAPMPDKQIKQIVYTQNSSNKIERRFFYYEAEFNQADKLLKFNIFDNLISRTPLFVILPIRKP